MYPQKPDIKILFQSLEAKLICNFNSALLVTTNKQFKKWFKTKRVAYHTMLTYNSKMKRNVCCILIRLATTNSYETALKS